MGGSLAVIVTLHRRAPLVPRLAEAMRAQARRPDRLWLVYDELDDAPDADWGCLTYNVVFHSDEGNPMASSINAVLDLDNKSDYIAYLTDDSLPAPDKYRAMAQALDEHPEWGAVYCSQDYGSARDFEHWLGGGQNTGVRHASAPQGSPDFSVDHTQVMHRRSDDRWPTEQGLRHHGDGVFFSRIVERFGPLQPVGEVLDTIRQLPDGMSARG